MSTFVPQVSSIEYPSAPPQISESGQFEGNVSPSAPWTMVRDRFEQSLATAEEMYERIAGDDGYLQAIEDVITEFPSTGIANIVYNNISIGSDVGIAVQSPPTMSGVIDLDFGEFTTPFPTLSAIPTVDLSELFDADLPEDITAAISWFESAHDSTLYTTLFNRLVADLQSGATGLSEAVEQAIFDRAQARQELEEDKVQTEIEEYFASMGFDLPTGAMAARLQEHANGRAMRTLDLNQKIMIEQAELAQKNSQFVIEAAKGLESLLLDYDSKKNDRALDYSKAVAANAVARYAEGIKAFVAKLEANRNHVLIQVENLKAAIEANKMLLAGFSAEAEAFKITVDAQAKRNEAITDVFKTEMAGYDSETKAISENQKNLIAAYDLRMKDARNDLDAKVASADTSIKGYTSEYSLRMEVAKAGANIAMQAMASAYGAVNSSAGLSYSGSESVGESWSHGETRSDSYSHSESISSTVTLSNDLKESHSYTEK